MTKESGFKRRVRARMASTGESYAGARAQLHRPGALHITNGDSAATSLRAAGLEGEVLAWTGVHPDGPVAMPDPAQAAAVAAHGGALVPWFEADLYHQLLLIQVRVGLGEQGVEPARATLVSIGEYPGRAHFGGLGELQPAELAGLL